MRALVTALLLTACSSDDGGPVDGDTAPDTDTVTDTDTDGTVATTQAVVRLDGVEVTESTFSGEISVQFYWEDGPHVGSPFSATLAEDSCAPDPGTSNPPPPTATTTTPFGGVVHLDLDGSSVTLSNGSADLATWPAGQAVTFSSRDGDVADFALPAFFAVPEPPTAARTEVLVNGALDVSWGGAPSGLVYVTVSGASGSTRCLVVDDGSFMVVPSELDAVGSNPQVFVARSLEVVEHLPGVDVTGWAFVSASAN